ncbi:alpha/beta-hydrolase [Lepidopterella palustris CBS 459.81]|uniref:Alpha/beta-hydrolase n=1 Tax=Lepidopterella palustris CBS 459.81 TaxID=1314670 RepID=A0A8E2E4R0_9PEZI|nr:alpha/beta-hydrolase [Lepidopterella palustris CBS 459.81]
MLLTKEEILKSSEIDPAYKKAVEANPINISDTDISAARASRAAHLETLRQYYTINGPVPEVIETDHQVPTRDGQKIRVRVYSPKHPPSDGSPLILMFHEGGWCMGDLTDENLNCRMFCRDLGAVCVNVEYRLAPEHPFPVGVNDSWDALKWASANASSFKANPERGFIVGGASAGGNIAAVLAHLARDEGLYPPLTGQYLCVAALLHADGVPEKYKQEYQSRFTNSSDPVLDNSKWGTIDVLYKPVKTSPLWEPFNHPLGHKGVAKAYFQVCGMDPLRDESLIYEHVLREESSVATKLHFYPGYGHMF